MITAFLALIQFLIVAGVVTASALIFTIILMIVRDKKSCI